MGKICKNKRVVSVLVALLMIVSIPLTVSAGSGNSYYAPTDTWKMYFQVRASGSYADIGDCVIVYERGKYYPSYIVLTSDVTIPGSITLPKGTRWTFWLWGDEITLNLDLGHSPALTQKQRSKVRTLKGTIHFYSHYKYSSTSIPFWKIDGLESGFYFKSY
ncbi:MAG: hypothetical protein IK020_02160 [Clostridiales bacterium]|nr:hypothetical protein [Clostridiales bacterium]